ncbi:MAG TPA: hypothetical protein VF800_15380 [Telluria sp.]|jgi:hypothetical protein
MEHKLAIVYQAGFPLNSFQEFAHELSSDSINVHLEERPASGPLLGIMWTMMTLGVVFIGSNYFGGIFKELGKDHYEMLKKALAKLTEKTMNMPKIEPVLVGTSGKIGADDPISMAFPVWVELPNKKYVKLLVPKKTSEVDYPTITNAFLDFVMACYEKGDICLADAGFDISRPPANPITFAYNPEARQIEWANPIPIR